MAPNFRRLDADRPEISRLSGAITIYRLRDGSHASILIACTKRDWKAAFDRDELIAQHGADCPLPELLNLVVVVAPSCSRVGHSGTAAGRTTSSRSRARGKMRGLKP